MPKSVFDENKNGDLDILEKGVKAEKQGITKLYGALEQYFPSWVGYNMAKCGGCIRACDRACYIHLENEGKLKNAFKSQFRKREDWKLPNIFYLY